MRYRILLLSGLMLASPAQALDIEPITVRSALGQPLLAEIPIEATADELRELHAGLAPTVVFARVGLPRPQGAVAGLRFAVVDARKGPLIRITTDGPVTETFFTFLVQLEWSSGKMIREFSVALQEPASMPVAQLPAIMPPQPAPAQPAPTQLAPTQPAPAATDAAAAETLAMVTEPATEIAPIQLATPATSVAPIELVAPVAEVAPIELAAPATETAPIELSARPSAAAPAPALPETLPENAAAPVAAAPVAAIPLRQARTATPPSAPSAPRPAPETPPAPPPADEGKPAPRTAIQSTEPSPVIAVASGGRRYGPVQPGEALSRIAARIDEDGSRHEQALAALLLANPDAFIGGNINRLKRGAVLRLPSQSELASIQTAHAQRLVHLQIRAWHEGPGSVADTEMATALAAVEADMTAAASAAVVAPDSGRLEITPPGPRQPDDALSQPATPDVFMPTAADPDDETIASREAEIEHLRRRVAELEGSSEEMQRVIAIQDQALAKAQQRLAQGGGDGGSHIVAARSPWPWAAAAGLLLAGLAIALKYRRARLSGGAAGAVGRQSPRWHRS